MQSVRDKLQELLDNPNVKIEDFYFTERRDMGPIPGPDDFEDDEREEWGMQWPTGSRRLFFYVKWTVKGEVEEYERRSVPQEKPR